MKTGIKLHLADSTGLAWAQRMVTTRHYLQRPVDSRCSPVAYLIELSHPAILPQIVGCLIFGRPEATRCYDGKLTYGSLKDVRDGRAAYDRWEVLNLARVWLSPHVQESGTWCRPSLLPGFVDRRGRWRSTLASAVIELALASVGYDYLMQRPPCFPDEPYVIKAVLSYCDMHQHKGTIYRAAGFALARTNVRGIQTWWKAIGALSTYEHAMIEQRAGQSYRSRLHRARRAAPAHQERFE